MLRILSLALVALLLVVPGVPTPASAAGPAAPAEACEPFDVNDAQHVRAKLAAADTVFEGRVVSAARVEDDAGTAEFRHMVQVLRVYAGDVTADERVAVVTLPVVADGHGPLQNRARYLIFANDRSDGSQVVDRCSGTTRLNRPLLDSQAALLEQLIRQAEQAARRVVLQEPASGVDDAPTLTRLALPGAVISLLGLLALLAAVVIGARRPQ